jgi:6-phosphogluconate dehydrogenase
MLIEQLLPLLEEGDILIDGGNSHYPDTVRRTAHVESKGLLYVGTGVSGGEEGALKGPSLMPGGCPEAWPLVKPLLQAISAKVDDGTPCCDWVGSGGAGHFVKMVHNGIEYGDIELICECYQLMRDGLGMTNAQMQEAFSRWNHGDLDSYLIGITADILGKKDTEGRYILDTILDTAGQKGTGKWTVQAALDQGVPLSLISESVFARCLSSRKEERVSASALLDGPAKKILNLDLEDLRKALLAAKIVSYAQGFSLMDSASKQYRWNLDLGAVSLLWRGGCIIRSVFLGRIKDAYEKQPGLTNLMLSPWFRDTLAHGQAAWRRVVSEAVLHGIPVPSLSAGLNYYDGYRCARLPANLLQAQRDYFGAHTYERTDRPRGEFFHTEWL